VDDQGGRRRPAPVSSWTISTGRMMPGRLWSYGHARGVEARKWLKIARRTTDLATITLQNYFRMYTSSSGIPHLRSTEAEEFAKIYYLDSRSSRPTAPWAG